MNTMGKVWEPIDFTIYFRFIRWPALLALVLEIALRWWAGRLSGDWLVGQLELIAWLIRLAAFTFISWRATKSFGASAAIAATAGVLSGSVIGLVIALTRFFSGLQLWKFFNLITETVTVAVVGSLVAILMVYLLSLKK